MTFNDSSAHVIIRCDAQELSNCSPRMKRYALLLLSKVYGCFIYYRWDGSLQPMWRKRSDQCRKSSSLCCDSDKAPVGVRQEM